MDIQKLIDSIYLAKTDIECVARFFQLHDFRVLHSDFNTSLGKIDLIVTDETTLIVVLVNSKNKIAAQQSLSKRVEELSKATASYMKRFRLKDFEVRFDIVNIDRANKTISHKPNAFDCYLNY